jgi:hypothetical protein
VFQGDDRALGPDARVLREVRCVGASVIFHDLGRYRRQRVLKYQTPLVIHRALGSSGALFGREQGMGTMDDIHLEELSVRMMLMKMDDAFCEALLRAIDAGVENAPTITSKLPGTRNPKTLTAA